MDYLCSLQRKKDYTSQYVFCLSSTNSTNTAFYRVFKYVFRISPSLTLLLNLNFFKINIGKALVFNG